MIEVIWKNKDYLEDIECIWSDCSISAVVVYRIDGIKFAKAEI